MSNRRTAVRAVRGATRVDTNTRSEIETACAELVSTVLERNGLDCADVVSFLFTATEDVTAQFPALAVRSVLGIDDVPMLCARELAVPSAPTRMIRLLAHVETARERSEISHVYLRGSDVVRPDLAMTGDR